MNAPVVEQPGVANAGFSRLSHDLKALRFTPWCGGSVGRSATPLKLAQLGNREDSDRLREDSHGVLTNGVGPLGVAADFAVS